MFDDIADIGTVGESADAVVFLDPDESRVPPPGGLGGVAELCAGT